MKNNITNAMTVDVEDYFHVAALAECINRNDWDSCEYRVEKNTHRLLELFTERQVKATFFILGWVAERSPELVRAIVADGHEVACHGYSHQLIYTQTPDLFREETLRAKQILEDIVQKPVYGYRAASYSITQQSKWALDILAEAGFTYDSSIVPVRHDLYGIPGAPAQPNHMKTPKGHSITEFPPSTLSIFGYRLPVAGGGYFRLYPYTFTRLALSLINKRERQPFIFYLHPWEIDPEQPRIEASAKSRFRHYNNLDKCEARLCRLMEDFKFSTVKDVLAGLDLWEGTETLNEPITPVPGKG